MQNFRMVGENSCPILSRFWTKVHEIITRSRKRFVLFKTFSDCLCHVSLRRYSPLSLVVVAKPNKCKSFLASNFLGRTTPTFRRLCWCDFCLPLGKVLLSSVTDLRLRSRAIKQNAESTEGGQNAGRVLSRLETKVHDILRRCRETSCSCQRTFPIVYIMFHSEA